MIDAGYIYLDLADLQTIQAACKACLLDNFTNHQSYTIAGRTINRANIGQVSQILKDVSYAIAYQTGSIVRTSVPDMSNGNGCRRFRWQG